MKKLFKLFKKLPPEMRMLLAMVGLASPVGAIYFLRRATGLSMIMLILYVGGALLLLFLLILLISWLFSRGKKKRTKSMERELSAQGEAGPQAMDTGGDIKANTAKYLNAVRDLKKNVGISVYDLPWYVVIGDSGCGKTKLVNEAGLTFSTGKPEGYRLGTLNYNWWFSEDAIFIDMAGRLCNPQDDGDRREWLALLDTVAKGRKGFPINGVLVCVSAEHLLQDAPEKHEADANTALERLRDLQTRLGVTFATYLIVTKCDKILGFMPFFDRAERDITIKNQMFGWSKPGGFDELYDPEEFKGDFDSVYGRLHELRLRRLNDEAEEIDLGLAYSFPEEFRSLYDPLQIYVRTLFPYIKNPRAVKNLIFRGVYFTSATQEGGVILKHLTERLGPEAADQFEPLDSLYPNKRPHFIRDVLFRKVFPEHGLVFRNEQQVVRNKRLHKVLKAGTAVVCVLLVAGFFWSYRTFNRVILNPRVHAESVADSFGHMTAVEALRQAGRIRDDANTIREHRFAATFLSAGFGTGQPTYQLERIRASLVKKALDEALSEVGKALKSGAGLREPETDKAKKYLAALEQYIAWFGCRREQDLPAGVTHDGFKALCGVTSGTVGSITGADDFDDHTWWYFTAIREDRELASNPAALLAAAHLNSRQTIDRALTHVYRYYSKYFAALSEEHANKDIAEWIRIRNASAGVYESYLEMLGASAEIGRVATLEQLRDFRTRFLEWYGRFDAGVNGLSWRGENTDSYGRAHIPSLADLVWEQRQQWVERIGSLRDAAQNSCGAADGQVGEVVKTIEALGQGGDSQKGLDRELWDSLEDLALARGRYDAAAFEDEESFKGHIVNVYNAYREILEFAAGNEETGDTLRATDNARQVFGHLKTIHDNLDGLKTDVPPAPSGQSPKHWIQTLKKLSGASRRSDEPIAVADLTEYWQPDALGDLHQTQGSLVSRGRTTRLLLTMLGDLEWAGRDDWGYARLFPYEQIAAEVKAPYTIDPPDRLPGGGAARPERDVEGQPAQEEPNEEFDIFGTARRPQEPDAPRSDESPRRRVRGRGSVPQCVTHEFLSDRAAEWVSLLFYVRHGPGQYLDDRTTANEERLHIRCTAALRQAAGPYLDTYVSSWSNAYRTGELNELEDLTEKNSTWSELARALDRRTVRERVAEEFKDALSWILRSTRCATYDANKRKWWGDYAADEGREVADWFAGSLEEEWDADLGLFVREDRFDVADQREDPWTRAAVDFTGQWLDLAEEIGGVKKIPRRFRDMATGDSSPLPSITWGAVKELREKYGLEDERLTGELEKFERLAQELLSSELSSALAGIQEEHFGAANPNPGWPYLNGDELETVDFEAFKLFLAEVRNAQEKFRELDPAGSPGYRQRRDFYAACATWREFLWPRGRAGDVPDDLAVTVVVDNPMVPPYGKGGAKPDDGCQHYATWCVLDLGFEVADEGLETACETALRKTHEMKWDWLAREAGPLRVYLKGLLEGVKDPGEQKLGDYSPLALCAYLQSRGSTKDRSTWYVMHTFDVSKRQAGSGVRKERIAQKLRFKLDRKMPDPIEKLRLLPGSGRGGER